MQQKQGRPFGYYFLLGIILFLTFQLYVFIEAFLPALASACVLGYLANPLYTFLNKHLKRPAMTAFTVIFFIFALLFVPLTLVLYAVQRQVQTLFSENTLTQIENSLSNGQSFLINHLKLPISESYIDTALSNLINTLQEVMASLAPKMIFGLTGVILSVFITFFIMFFLLIDSRKIIDAITYYGPLSDKNMKILLHEMGNGTRALIYGQLLIAMTQGTLTAIGFLIFGVSGAFLWGLVTVIASFIPALGSGIVWFPACIYLFIQAEYFKAVGLLVWGVLVVGTSDNLLRPKLTSILGEIHPVTVLLGVFIGIKEWGIIGIVMGPLVISVLIILIKMFREQYLDM